MNRSLLVTIHLYLSSFFAAAVLLVAVSGGLYLIGVKGSVQQEAVGTFPGGAELLAEPDVDQVLAVLATAGIDDFSFEYVKKGGNTVFTRPTSRLHYVLAVDGDAITVTRNTPDLQKRMIELHKGHGPTLFKTFQKVFAAGMIFMILSGLWLGLQSPRLRRTTLITAGSGLVVFLGLVLL